jgi:hypothetical protein
MTPPTSGSKSKPKFLQADISACYLLHAGLFLGLIFDIEDGGDMFFRNVG